MLGHIILNFLFLLLLFFFNDTATTEIYTLSLHDALPIYTPKGKAGVSKSAVAMPGGGCTARTTMRSEEHTSELQSPDHLVCRLLLEKKMRPKQEQQKAIGTGLVSGLPANSETMVSPRSRQ